MQTLACLVKLHDLQLDFSAYTSCDFACFVTKVACYDRFYVRLKILVLSLSLAIVMAVDLLETRNAHDTQV